MVSHLNKGDGGILFKVNFAKAYDSVNQYFLNGIMKWMGFGKKMEILYIFVYINEFNFCVG